MSKKRLFDVVMDELESSGSVKLSDDKCSKLFGVCSMIEWYAKTVNPDQCCVIADYEEHDLSVSLVNYTFGTQPEYNDKACTLFEMLNYVLFERVNEDDILLTFSIPGIID